MRGVKEEVSGCKQSVEKMLHLINVWESMFTECKKERVELRNEIDNLKKVNEEKVKEIEKLKRENEHLNGPKEVQRRNLKKKLKI